MTAPPPLSSFKAMSFDCYGTIIDWERGILAALRPWIEAGGLTLDDEEILATFAEAEPLAERAKPDALYPDILRAVVNRMAKVLGIDPFEDDGSAPANTRLLPWWSYHSLGWSQTRRRRRKPNSARRAAGSWVAFTGRTLNRTQ